ncbi:hypothetical protein HYPSUDRAFT_1023963 [Hypholoma sublateritium FD-334 SS-4]|uniref:F-box domain-containing protein n=1 Tax=Hypholoma sublateritium (strain FD-334 SS-4) TaxID=945553 RepID=A0A0D2NE63_HYPSF|nr:hypothetical protein HYPSUDRAFT_1023963 [Hypholoma sublateritium FD-334 SS-4]
MDANEHVPLEELLLMAEDCDSHSSMDSDEQLAMDLALIEMQQMQEHIVVEPLRVDLLNLPADVIAQIFCEACRPIPNDQDWTRQFYPLWLGRFCRAWRQIAWSTSELWTTIVVRTRCKGIVPPNYPNQLELLEQWVERTKGRKLDILFDDSSELPAFLFSAPSPASLLQVLVSHSERWESIELHFPKIWNEISPFTPAQPLSLPNLRSVTLRSELYGENNPPPPQNFTLAPLLRNLEFSHISVERIAFIILPPSRKIIRLTLTSCSALSLRGFCKKFPHLQEVTFASTEAGLLHHPPNTVLHERLSSLTIKSAVNYTFFFNQLTLPSLKQLNIELGRPLAYTQELLPFLERSACMLTTLTLKGPITREYDLIELLQGIPSLEVLHLVNNVARCDTFRLADTGLGSTFFEQLDPDEAAPYLTSLAVFSYSGILAVQAIDFMEPFIVRARVRDAPEYAPDEPDAPGTRKVARLRQATIRADQYSDVAEFSIAEYSDTRYIWEVARMLEEGILVLLNMDGSLWS